MKYCDLHNHSIFSDGSNTPRELILHARSLGIDAIALTDHNTIEGLLEFDKAAKELNFNAVLGSELTCEFKGKEVHMLCMFIDLNHTQGITKFIKAIRMSKRGRNIELAERLSADGYNIDLFALERRFGNNVNRAHFGVVLTEMGVTSSVSEAFATILAEGGKYYTGSPRPDAIKTITDILSWGCVPVMAHPLISLSKEELEEFLPLAAKAGLVGAEAYYSKFTDEETKYIESLCNTYGILKSGGSDYHGSIKPDVQMGMARVPYSCYESLVQISSKIKQK